MADRPHADPPGVTVVVCFLDELRFLEAAIATVYAQDETAWELLLVDDGSTDGSGEVADRAAAEDPGRVRVLRHPGGRNEGLPASRNLAFRHARGEFVALLDADDVWEPRKLKRQLAHFAAHPTAGMVCGPARFHFLETDRPDEVRPLTAEPGIFGPLAFARALVWGAVVPPAPSSVMLRTDALRAAGGVPAGPNMYEDQRLWVAISMHRPVFVGDEALLRYTVRPDSVYGSVAADAETAWRHRMDFERWIVRRAARFGWRGTLFAVEAVARRMVARLRALAGDARRRAGRTTSPG